ncbi:MAG: isoleucine--tRNA ligase [Deltaproteobacteria bacterium]|nr:isoleucine--tRNA ligase [Deltaproteobacteria bacterium]
MISPEKTPYAPVSHDVNIPAQEAEILAAWDQGHTFQKSLDATRDAPFYSFYDGPPFATGLPHYGHLLAGVLKDIVPRYWTMRGRHVPRRFGWDCHGLPVEYEINKALNVQDRKQIIAMGVDKYNEACRGIVTRYTEEWKRTVRRIGRWVDMDHAYFTMDPSFMQSVWWVFKRMWDQGLIYEGYKVVPYSVGISTPLSNFEAKQNYKDVQDPALTLLFKVRGEENLFFLAWTTTPWTLPSNLGLAVGKDLDYVRVRDPKDGRRYIVAEALRGAVFGKHPVEEEARFKGAELIGKKYEPLFPYFAAKEAEGAFRVIHADHVTIDAGTGVVHMAPAFGEEDFIAGKAAGLPIVNPVDDDGLFTAEVKDWAGRKLKEADPEIIAHLKARGIVFKHETITHAYPFCYRSDTPLIYRAVTSWFVKVEAIKARIIAANKQTCWVPETLRDGRFGNWLEEARDWAISRNRFWGTPLPVWRNAEGETICIGSSEELEQLSGTRVTDLHTHHVDRITIPSQKGGSPLKRIEPVLDCWFESGSMPYAEHGYPVTGKERFEKGFPAEFIAEGLDQTRGWFYTLMVIGTALFDRAPFKNVVVNGLVLAEDGKKMSKRLRNYPDPNEVLDRHGADALRLYMIDSPVVKAQELRFSEKGVRDVVRRILLRWWNAYSFFVNYANIDAFVPRGDAEKSPNILDQWILSKTNTLIHTVNEEMEKYRLYNVVPALLSFIEELTNTYIRFNRRHFWADGMPEDKRLAFETLYEVLLQTSRVMAPFTPFMADNVFRNLARVRPGLQESVHLERFPAAREELRKPALEASVERMEKLVEMGRNLREKIGVKAKIPLRTLRVIHRNQAVLEDLKRLEGYFVEELNVREVVYDADEAAHLTFACKANFPRLGPRLGPRMKVFAAAVSKLSPDELNRLEEGGTLTLEGETITREDVDIRRAPLRTDVVLASTGAISIELDPTVTREQQVEGLGREVLRRVQMARKSARLKLDDRIHLSLALTGELLEAAQAHQERIAAEALAVSVKFEAEPTGAFVEKSDVDGDAVGVGLTKA